MNRKFDDIIKKKLDNYDSKYPDHMWESIAKKLPEKKRKPYYIWFLVIFLALLSYGLTYYSFNKLNKENRENRIPISGNTNTSTLVNQEGINTNAVSKETSELSIGGYEAGREINDIESRTTKNVKNELSNGSNIEKANYSAGKNTINALQYIDNFLNPFLANKEPLTNGNLSGSNVLNHEGPNESGANDFSLKSDFEKQEALQIANISGKNTQHVLSSLAGLTLDNQLSELAKKHAALACPTFVKKQNTNTIEFYFSNDFARRKLEIKRGDGINYMNQRNQTEVAHLSNSFGFRLGMGWESGIAFKTGLNYTSINEKFIYTDPNSIQKKTITVVKYKYDDDLNIIDSTVTQEIVEIPGTNTIVSKNRYSFIDIPVLFQYSISGKKRLSYDVTVGPYINLLVNQSGKIIDDSGKKIVTLNNDEGSKLFKNNVGVSFYGSVAINYQLTKQMKMSLEPNFRYMPSSITSYTNNLDQKYLIAGISAGVKIRI